MERPLYELTWHKDTARLLYLEEAVVATAMAIVVAALASVAGNIVAYFDVEECQAFFVDVENSNTAFASRFAPCMVVPLWAQVVKSSDIASREDQV